MGEHHPAASPEEAQALAERVASAMYARDRASQALGMHIVRVGAGHAELSMRVRADMLNGHLDLPWRIHFFAGGQRVRLRLQQLQSDDGRLGLHDRIRRTRTRK